MAEDNTLLTSNTARLVMLAECTFTLVLPTASGVVGDEGHQVVGDDGSVLVGSED
jgi:hypothetical protein